MTPPHHHPLEPYFQTQHRRHLAILRSPPTSPAEHAKTIETSAPSSPQSYSSSISSSSLLYAAPPLPPAAAPSSSASDHGTIGVAAPPLTLQERRQRNKTASAKYRQKKNQQQHEMRQMIGQLSEQNAVLERQLQELRMENEKLKATTDRLRGKIVARKMLKQWIGRQKEPTHVSLQQQQQQQPHQHHHHSLPSKLHSFRPSPYPTPSTASQPSFRYVDTDDEGDLAMDSDSLASE
ncbi:uncharacterized protein BYT42DRAFT_499030 [Radiomyces spectabilis]|uniref:uncharacterized protein n=1 Tax=Radiomyces spectabilis TaxID=64574 RepID=UPI00221E497D|nr:uncharacterized protein BYT42DRAFT_499030 [Radiomyces spectabilis]KAI8376179.1 hypothetical protein BYT42DRAFT_499030 [Radiomyces spectabilis]